MRFFSPLAASAGEMINTSFGDIFLETAAAVDLSVGSVGQPVR
jgi:hypothetical protein